jgi:UDP-N-acetylmuramate: L-alanyl-gamma-D-glutamyl-meso-diaminopimelate ligase
MMFTNPAEFKAFLFSLNLEQTAVVLMSSGNYGGLDFDEVKELV